MLRFTEVRQIFSSHSVPISASKQTSVLVNILSFSVVNFIGKTQFGSWN